MKNETLKRVALLAMAAMTAVSFAGCAIEAMAATENEAETADFNDESTFITEEEVKTVAFNKAGAEESEVYNESISFNYGVYKIDFSFNGMNYKYRIDGISGEIIFENACSEELAKQEEEQIVKQSRDEISIEEAMEIVCKDLAIEDAICLGSEFNGESGEYEFEFTKDGMKYEYFVAASGDCFISTCSVLEN